MITWLWNAAPEHERTVHNVAVRMVFLSLASIHNLSFVRFLAILYRNNLLICSLQLLTHVLFNLATYTSYIEPLREEINSIVRTEGWTKAAIDNMQKLDSFVKESQRLHGSDAGVFSCMFMFKRSDVNFNYSRINQSSYERLRLFRWYSCSQGLPCSGGSTGDQPGRGNDRLLPLKPTPEPFLSGTIPTLKNSKGSVL